MMHNLESMQIQLHKKHKTFHRPNLEITICNSHDNPCRKNCDWIATIPLSELITNLENNVVYQQLKVISFQVVCNFHKIRTESQLCKRKILKNHL
jgi:hypothetical protein